jgi:hypothetical protein
MGRRMVGKTNGYGRPCIKIYPSAEYEVSVTFRDNASPEEVVIFTKKSANAEDYTKYATEELFPDEANGCDEIPISDFDDLMRIIDHLTPTKPVEEVDFGEIKRGLVSLGHKLALTEEAFYRDEKPGPAFKAKRAKLSIIDAIVEVGHILDGNIFKIKI